MNLNIKTVVIKRIAEVFGDKNKRLLCFSTFNASLNDIPINTLNNKVVTQKLIDDLGRIEHDVFI